MNKFPAIYIALAAKINQLLPNRKQRVVPTDVRRADESFLLTLTSISLGPASGVDLDQIRVEFEVATWGCLYPRRGQFNDALMDVHNEMYALKKGLLEKGAFSEDLGIDDLLFSSSIPFEVVENDKFFIMRHNYIIDYTEEM